MRTSVRVAMEGDSCAAMTSNQKGAIAEEAIAAEATKLGIVVSRPNVDARYDLIFDTGSSLQRVQCKWGALDVEAGVINVNLTTNRCTPTGYARTTYGAGEVDLFAVYCGERDRCYLLEADGLVGGVRSAFGFQSPEMDSELALILLQISPSMGL